MVLESIFKTKVLLNNNVLFLLYTTIVSIISVAVSLVFFKESASILSLAFITFAFIYFLNSVYFHTEKEVLSHETSFFRRYLFVIEIYVKIFFVLVIVFTSLYIFLPQEYRDLVFKEQVKTLENINELRSSFSVVGDLYVGSPIGLFWYIFLNNLGVLLAILLFSFLYGVGALFIIVYQASVFGTLVGTKILSAIPNFVAHGIYGQVLAIIQGYVAGLGLLPHGVFELLAYFLAAIIGGIVSAILHGHFVDVRRHLLRLILDLSIIFGVAILCLIMGALIESHIILG